jgi:CRP/FNR family nitrogen fixation transcriptional regulator
MEINMLAEPIITTMNRPGAAKRPAPAVALPQGLFGSPVLTGALLSFTANAEIYGEGEPADCVYKVVSGAVRTYRILSDGRRQIVAFYLAGDIFGLEAGPDHPHCADAIGNSVVMSVKRALVESEASEDRAVARQIWQHTASELRGARSHSLLLVQSAEERVKYFLQQMAARNGQSNTIVLPMARQDIADYLGLTIETVSRTLTLLEARSQIALPSSRKVVLRQIQSTSRV